MARGGGGGCPLWRVPTMARGGGGGCPLWRVPTMARGGGGEEGGAHCGGCPLWQGRGRRGVPIVEGAHYGKGGGEGGAHYGKGGCPLTQVLLEQPGEHRVSVGDKFVFLVALLLLLGRSGSGSGGRVLC